MSETGQTNEKPSRRGHVDGFIEEIAWLINDAPRELGVRGVTVDPSGGGGRMPDPFVHHLRRKLAVKAVERERRAMAVWVQLTREHQNVLAAAYTNRRQLAIHGAEATFGSVMMAGVALVTAPNVEGLVDALRDATNARHRPLITEARKRAAQALRDAHRAWSEAWRSETRRELEGDDTAPQEATTA